jgi:UDP-N-acetyl-2-amino-2-deoxyglucuronate dehydrogenase
MKSYNVSIIGLGRISYKHLESFKKLENFFKVTAISDLKISNFNKAKKKFTFINNCKFYSNYIDMIKSEKPDISIILTESGNHAKNYFKIAKYCKNIIIEKPLCLNQKDLSKILLYKKKYKNNIFVVMQNRYNIAVQFLKENIKNNKLGRIFFVSSSIKWKRDKKYYDQAKWRGTYNLDGGVIGNQGAHQLDLIISIIGKIKKINTMGIKALNNKIEYHDTVAVNMLSKNNILCSLRVTTAARPKDIEGTLCVMGDKGAIKIGGYQLNKIEYANLQNSSAKKPQKNEKILNVYGTGHFKFYQNVYENINKKLNNFDNSFLDSCEVSKVIEQINKKLKKFK